MDVTRISLGLHKTPEQSAEIKEQYSRLSGSRGFISKGLALVLFVPLAILRFVALVALTLVLSPFVFLLGIFAPKNVRDNIGANKTSRLGYVGILLFSPILIPIGLLVTGSVCLQKLPETFRVISLGFDNVFSKIAFGIMIAVMKFKSKGSNSADYSVRSSTTMDLNSKLGVDPKNSADFSNATNAKPEAAATTPAAKPADANNDTSYAFAYSPTARKPGKY